jgi:STE24 endopeptidase
MTGRGGVSCSPSVPSRLAATEARAQEASPRLHRGVRRERRRASGQDVAARRARSDAYFEGGYWLLWDYLYGAGIALLLLGRGWSARMRDLAQRVTRFRSGQAMLYWIQYLLAVTVLGFPLAVYEGFFREHKYGLATQTFGPWLGDQAKGLLVGLVTGGLLVVALFAVVRKLGRSWWLWGAGVTSLFIVIGALIAPVFIAPLFNTYTKLSDARVRDPILSMARANGST